MNDLKTRWVKALRSGRYRQGVGALEEREQPKGNCCLGVLCRVARVPRPEWEDEGALSDNPFGDALMEQLGMTKDQELKLIAMNDNSVPFSEIADWIEENL